MQVPSSTPLLLVGTDNLFRRRHVHLYTFLPATEASSVVVELDPPEGVEDTGSTQID